MTTMMSGTYRNAYAASAVDHNPSDRLRTFESAEPAAATTDPCGESRKNQRRECQHDRQHAAERPIARFEKLLLDQIADQAVVRSAENVGNRKNSERGNEHQCGAGVNTGQ